MTVTLTLEQALALKPCNPDHVEALLKPGRTYTAREAADAGFSLSDLLWVLHELAQKDARLARLERHLAADYADHVLHVYEEAHPGDTRPRDAIQAARDYADGKIDAKALAVASEASIAHAASAAAAASCAAYYAASAAAYAARAAAAAARAAAAAYAYAFAIVPNAAAAFAAACASESEWQLNRLLERLEDGQ